MMETVVILLAVALVGMLGLVFLLSYGKKASDVEEPTEPTYVAESASSEHVLLDLKEEVVNILDDLRYDMGDMDTSNLDSIPDIEVTAEEILDIVKGDLDWKQEILSEVIANRLAVESLTRVVKRLSDFL